MKILFLNTNNFVRNELQECISDIQGEAFFAVTPEEAIAILNTHSIDMFFLELKGISDTGLLKYVNENFKDVRIILTVEGEIEHAISTIKNGHFGVLQKPFTLKQLRELLGEEEIVKSKP
jgi:DNA-binding NtrC family response regulator